MSFGGIFRSTFGRKGLGQPAPSVGLHAAMAAELQRLDLYKPGYGARASRYVATGDDPAIVDAIAACAKASPAYACPYRKDYDAKAGAQRATDLALVRGEIQPGSRVARMMRVRCAADPSYIPISLGSLSAEQLPVAALFLAIGSGLAGAQVRYAVPWETIIPLRGLLDLTVAAGGGVRDLFDFILRRNETSYLTERDSWHAGEAMEALIRAHPDLFAQALLAARSDRRATALALAEHHRVHGLPEMTAALVALLTKPYGKTEREFATASLARLEAPVLRDLLDRVLPDADIDTRFGLVQAAGSNGGPELIPSLAARAAVEKAAKVKAALQTVLETADTPSEASADGPGYAAIDGSFVAIPPVQDLGTDEAPEPSDEECFAFMRMVEAIDAHRAEMLAQQPAGDPDRRQRYEPLTREEIEASFELLTQGTPVPAGIPHLLLYELQLREAFRAWYDGVLDRLPPRVALRSLTSQSYAGTAKLIARNYPYHPTERWAVGKLRGWVEAGRCGLREMHASIDSLRQDLARITYDDRPGTYETPLKELPAEAVWPWLAENLEILDEAFGLQPSSTPFPVERGVALLELLPAVPQRYLPKLLEIAVAEKRWLRRRVMALLRNARALDQRVEALLDDARQQVRASAAAWLADLRAPGAEAALRKRLKKEKSDPVRTALIEALQRLGADLSDVIGPASLIADAEKAEAKAAPQLPAWLAASGLPYLRFADGAPLPEKVLRHWLALAIRLKEPGATGQFGIYLDQLDPADAQKLSAWVLEGWIGFDTRAASLDEANAYAVANFAQDWRWVTQPQTAELRARLIADLAREKQGEMLNSGSDTKGVLALACRADPVWAANRVRWYLKKHGRRSNQAMALLDALAGIGAPTALQVVIAASARLKQKSTQAHAAAIAERYAEDRGWSVDELADRTVPSAGFDDDGVLELPCGEDAKPYSARLDASLAIHLFNPEGKQVKALPAGDDENSKESQKALTAAKKELKQVVDLQAARLFEAMCAERSWPVADWRSAFHEHPVMRRLVERLVWQGLDADGNPLGLFRPTQEGDFTDAADLSVDIEAFARLRLAHGALSDAETHRSWIAHLADYEVSPFLAQFDEIRAPFAPALADADVIADRQGWIAESLSYRGVAEKRGYERVMRDSGGCQEYAKSFPAQGITATIYHSGSNAVDENNRIALKGLSFSRKRHYGVPKLGEVPAVIRAECWADYRAVAAKGAFDPEWEKVAAW